MERVGTVPFQNDFAGQLLQQRQLCAPTLAPCPYSVAGQTERSPRPPFRQYKRSPGRAASHLRNPPRLAPAAILAKAALPHSARPRPEPPEPEPTPIEATQPRGFPPRCPAPLWPTEQPAPTESDSHPLLQENAACLAMPWPPSTEWRLFLQARQQFSSLGRPGVWLILRIIARN